MTVINNWKDQLITKNTNISPLIVFRIIFGLMMFGSTLRFVLKGWITEFYINPKYHFTYYNFDWIKPLENNGMYLLFAFLLLSTIFITLGLFYRFSIISYFLIFTYVELIDKTYYLNHYYFISLISFLLIFLPLNRSFSFDCYFGICKREKTVPSWTLNLLKLQIGIVYFFAGISKLNYHWLIEAQPLINWLKHLSDFPIIGEFFLEDYTAFIFSWFGALFDLSIFFILINNRLRIYGYIMVVIFHVMTSLMFPIGVFPLVMMGSTLIFFSESFHTSIINFLSRFTKKLPTKPTSSFILDKRLKPVYKLVFITFFLIQFIMPIRYCFYPGELFWTEQGYRFSWRVMLIEKVGYAQFYIHEPKEDRKMLIENRFFLTPQQEKMMATQPDMILQYSHYLSEVFKDSVIEEMNGEIIELGENPKVTANVKVSLFNKGSRAFIDNKINLTELKRGFANKTWILPNED